MKQIILCCASFLFFLLFASCTKNHSELESQLSDANIQKALLIEKRLDLKYSISPAVYKEFVESIIYDEKGNLIGAIYDKIENSFISDNQSNSFWSQFGISLRNQNSSHSPNFTEFEDEDDGEVDIGDNLPGIFEGYKPKRGGCKANNRWICVIRDY